MTNSNKKRYLIILTLLLVFLFFSNQDISVIAVSFPDTQHGQTNGGIEFYDSERINDSSDSVSVISDNSSKGSLTESTQSKKSLPSTGNANKNIFYNIIGIFLVLMAIKLFYIKNSYRINK